MKPSHHLILGSVAGVATIPILGPYSGAFVAASFLIDSDHYLSYVWRNRLRDFSLRRAISFNRRLVSVVKVTPFLGLDVFHTIEALLVVFILALILSHQFVHAIAWGMIFHIALDMAYLLKKGIIFKRAHSLLEYLVRRRHMINRGQKPWEPFQAILSEMGIGKPNTRD